MRNSGLEKIHHNFTWLGVFGIAMGILEAIVVVYLRQMYYPSGFDFPLSIFSSNILLIEWIREISTIIMLVSIGFLTGNNLYQRFSYFIYSFAVWDIFYYVGLKLFLGWPPSLLTWDLLFLIPVVWVGPVLAPIICSITMIAIAVIIVYRQEKGYLVKIKLPEWILILVGAFIIFCTFIWDYSTIIIQGGFLSEIFGLLNNVGFRNMILHYEPSFYNWYLFALGEGLILTAIIIMIKRVPVKCSSE
jgi:hypothetical protein